jgi:hypothetical protein
VRENDRERAGARDKTQRERETRRENTVAVECLPSHPMKEM